MYHQMAKRNEIPEHNRIYGEPFPVNGPKDL